MAENPNVTHRFSDATVSLWLGVSLVIPGGENVQADLMLIEHNPDGVSNNVFIFPCQGKRKVHRIKQAFEIQELSPATSIPLPEKWKERTESVTPEEESWLLSFYDRMDQRTYP